MKRNRPSRPNVANTRQMGPALVDRRAVMKFGLLAAAGAMVNPLDDLALADEDRKPLFKISLAQWSLHRALYGGQLDNLDFAATAKNDYGIDAVEYVNQFFKDKAKDKEYLGQMKKRAADVGVRSLLIMCDGEGAIGDPDEKKRSQAVENHHKWVTAARFLGCHSVRVNAQSAGAFEEQMKLAADGLRRLTEFGAKHDINVIVENHGGLSSKRLLAGGRDEAGRPSPLRNTARLREFPPRQRQVVRPVPGHAGDDAVRQGRQRQIT